jgi:hypothetical protein
MIMQGNEHKKTGAVNAVLERALPALPDGGAVLVQDADDFLDPGILSATSRKLGEGFGAPGTMWANANGGG